MAKGMPSKYKPEFCDLLIKHMADGLSFESFAAVVKVNRTTLWDWVKAHEDFREAKAEGLDENLLFYEKIGRAGMMGKLPGFNITAWIFNMKNRHGWRDKQKDEADVIVKNEITVAKTDVQDRIKQIKARKS